MNILSFRAEARGSESLYLASPLYQQYLWVSHCARPAARVLRELIHLAPAAYFFFLATPFVACTAFEATFVIFFVMGLASTMFLSYLRVCGVWNWSPFIVGLFGASWISVVASGFALINSIKGVEVEDNYCEEILVGQRILAPIITTFVNHTIVFLAIAFGVCKNTIGKDLSLGECLRLMLGRRFRTFTNALLHDSQVCYMWVFFLFAKLYVDQSLFKNHYGSCCTYHGLVLRLDGNRTLFSLPNCTYPAIRCLGEHHDLSRFQEHKTRTI